MVYGLIRNGIAQNAPISDDATVRSEALIMGGIRRLISRGTVISKGSLGD